MRRNRAVLALLVAVLAIPLLAGPASAGGPTSTLLVAPDTGRTASLYASDPDYALLAELVGAFGGDAATEDRSDAGPGTAPDVTVTWLLHDVQVWRVDRIDVDAPGGPSVSTRVVHTETGSVWDSPEVWQSVTRGKELTLLLDRLGLLETSAAGAAAATAAQGGAVPDRTPARSADGGGTGLTGPVWGLAGLALGLVLALAATRVRSRLGPTRGKPAEPATDAPPADPDADWVPTDQLTWPARR